MTMEAKVKPESQGNPPAKGQTSENTVKTYSEAEYLKAVSDERTISGRLKAEKEAITKERDTFKSQAEQAAKDKTEATETLEATKQSVADLEADLEQAMDSNPDAAEVQKIKKELRVEKAKLQADLKAEKEAATAEKEAARKDREEWAATVSEAQAMKFEVDVFEVAEEYEGGDPERLKKLAEAAGKSKRDEIQGLAEVIWSKKAGEDKANEANLITDSGTTNGGTTRTKAMIQKDYAASKISRSNYEKEMAAHNFRID